jgi:glycine dehydrogenase subunit 1
MLSTLGYTSIEDLYTAVPERLRFRGELSVPAAIPSEVDLASHFADLVAEDRRIPLNHCFRGAGCWPHAVPAICAEIVGRAEFRTAYWGNQYTDHGKYQAFFEYASLLGELLDQDAVSLPSYDWGSAAAVALRMSTRMTGRSQVVLAGELGVERRQIIRNSIGPEMQLVESPIDRSSGQLDLDALEAAIGRQTAAVYFECPSFLGVIDPGGPEACSLAHRHGALAVVGADPISLGVLAPPASYGADLTVGDLQSLGIPMQCGGGQAGYIASSDEERFISEYPSFLIGLTPTTVEGEHGFGFVAWDRTHYAQREQGKDFAGTTTALWAIAAAVYLALAGPEGIKDIGAGIIQRSHYAAERMAEIPNVRSPHMSGAFFKEFVVNLDGTGRTVQEVNRGLLERGFLGGHDLSREVPALGQSMLICVTEVHRQSDIDELAAALALSIEA